MSNRKVLFFTDIHFGEQLNSPLKLEIAIKNIDFIIDQIKKNDIETVIFCGDWFHSRASISVNTFYQSYNTLSRLAKAVTNLYMIVGNHDSYFKNTIEVHSLKAFEQIPNVKIIDKLSYINLYNKEFALAPWGIDISKIKHVDYLAGHLDPNGAQLCGTISQESTYNMEALTEIAPLVFSGHYHISKEYNTIKGKVIMVGSPSQQNWGDISTKRGCYILDCKTNQTEFIENTKAPVHLKFLYSHILETKKLPNLNDIQNNFINIVIDCPYKYNQVHKILEKLQSANPLTLETEYYYSEQIKLNLNKAIDIDKNIKTHKQYLEDFVGKMELDSTIKRNKLLDLALSIYSKQSTEA